MILLSTANGYDVGYLTGTVATGRENYYLSAAEHGGEPPGRWSGRGAADLGLRGEVNAEQMRALYHEHVAPDGTRLGGRPRSEDAKAAREDRIAVKVAEAVAAEGPYVTPERMSEITNEIRSRHGSQVAFFDFTFSAPKSVSLAHAGHLAAARVAREAGDGYGDDWHSAHAEHVEHAVRTASAAAIEDLERTALYTRTGHHSATEGEWRTARGAVVASFLQHTSRDGDVQLHVHNAVLNRVQRADQADEKWRTIDSRTLHGGRLHASAVGDAVLSAELHDAGYALVKRADGNASEIAGVERATMDAHSSRRTAVTAGLRPLVNAYTERHGHAPSQRALQSIAQFATLNTRPGKSHEVLTSAQQLAAWEATSTAREVQALADLPRAMQTARAAAAPVAPFDDTVRQECVRQAVATVQRRHATWTADHLSREIYIALPAVVRGLSGPEAAAFIDSMVYEAVAGLVPGTNVVQLSPAPDLVKVPGAVREDGSSVRDRPKATRYATDQHLETEKWLVKAAGSPAQVRISPEAAGEAVAAAGLGEDQAEAVTGLLSSNRAVDVFVGPAGTGKTRSVAVFAAIWQRETGGRVVGVTSATNAARVMKVEGLAESYNIADWLGKIKDETETRGNRPIYSGDVLVLDESSQASTEDVKALAEAARLSGARMILAGDTEQLASPEAGGVMRLLAAEHGYYQLSNVRRFSASWEGPASLRLRDGDPAAIREYVNHGRVREGTQAEMYDQALSLWLGDHLAGTPTVLLTATNEEAASLSRMARDRLVALGRVGVESGAVLSDGNDAGSGDLIRARQNAPGIDAGGQDLANRDVLRIESFTAAGAASVRRQDPVTADWSEPFTVPAAYLANHAELGYAGNTHVAEGKTTGTSHTIVNPGMARDQLYVGLTRGRESNTAYVVTSHPRAADMGGERPSPELAPESQAEATTAEAVLTDALSTPSAELTAVETLRQAQDQAASLPRLFALWKDATRAASYDAYDAVLREHLTASDYTRYCNDPERGVLSRQLRAAEMAGTDASALLAEAVSQRDLTGAKSVAAVLHGRIVALGVPELAARPTWMERTAPVADPEIDQAAREVAGLMDARTRQLGREAAADRPVWALASLGEAPLANPAARADWQARAGAVAAARELTGHADPVEPLGAAPAQGAAELLAAYRTASEALGITPDEQELREADDGELRARQTDYERELAWAPAYVAPDLRETIEAKADAQAEAVTAWAEADHTGSADASDRAAQATVRGMELAERHAALAEADDARRGWSDVTTRSQAAAIAATAELERRHPDEPPRQAPGEPAADTSSAEAVARVRERAAEAAGRVAERREAEAERAELGRAEHWREVQAERDNAVRQPWTPERDAQPAPAAELEAEM